MGVNTNTHGLEFFGCVHLATRSSVAQNTHPPRIPSHTNFKSKYERSTENSEKKKLTKTLTSDSEKAEIKKDVQADSDNTKANSHQCAGLLKQVTLNGHLYIYICIEMLLVFDVS